MISGACSAGTVSYTHLDVYKRQALGLGQSAWWCADDESVTWGGLGWPAFWVSQQQDGGRSVKYGSAWGSGVTELVLAGAEHDGTGGYVLTFSGYVRDDGVTGAFAGGAPVLAVSLNLSLIHI